MGVVRPVVRNVIRSVVRSAVRAPSVIQRYFTELNAAFGQYYTIPTVTLNGDFELNLSSSTTSTQLEIYLSGEDSIDRFYVGVETGKLLIGNGTDRTVTTKVISDGKLHNIKLSSSGGVLTAYVDGVVEYTNSLLASFPKTLINIGVGKSPTNFKTTGIISNVWFKVNGTLIRDYNIDESWSGGSTILNDSSGNNQHGTAVNITDAYAELFELNESTTPDQWESTESATIIQIAGTP